MEATGPAQPRSETGIEDGLAVAQQRPCVRDGHGLQETLGTDPGPSREQALEMARAQIELGREFVQRGLAARVDLEPAQGVFDAVVVAATQVHPGTSRAGRPTITRGVRRRHPVLAIRAV